MLSSAASKMRTLGAFTNSENHESVLGNYSTAAVASDGAGPVCATIGKEVLQRGGTAVDAAIVTLCCNGVISSQSLGIGGGFLMTVYHRKSGKATSIIARETAPAAATEDMFHGNAKLSSEGAMAVAIPGEIRGWAKAKELFGNDDVSWESLIRPSIKLCREGIPVTFSKALALSSSKAKIRKDPGLARTYIDPRTNDVLKEGDTYTRLDFAETLERIATLGPQEFYEGKTAQGIVKDLQERGGIITMEDMKNYKVHVAEPVKVHLGNGLWLHSVPPPGSGIILAYILNIMENYNLTALDYNDPLMYHRLVEAYKWGYAYRSKLGDPFDANITHIVNHIVEKLSTEEAAYDTFLKINDSATSNDPKHYGGDFEINKEDGTSHTSVLAPNGDAVAVTSTINLYFGSKIMSPSTGIIFNDQMDDFSSPNITNEFGLPPSPHNFIVAGKRPQSSICPSILVDAKGIPRIVAGATGGTKITSAAAFAILHNLWLDVNIKGAIDAKRIHHQLVPMQVDWEKEFPQGVLEGLKARGHKLNGPLDIAGSIVTGITRQLDGRIYANTDYRKAGGIDGF